MAKTTRSRRSAVKRANPAVEIETFTNAVRYLLERVDYERQRIIRYDEKTFKLDRMQAGRVREGAEEVGGIHIR
jgi:hypothetical protein